jgi:hypothetical protein
MDIGLDGRLQQSHNQIVAGASLGFRERVEGDFQQDRKTDGDGLRSRFPWRPRSSSHSQHDSTLTTDAVKQNISVVY